VCWVCWRAATEVVEILGDSLTLAETPIPLKIARLFLASDILHNTSSGVRNASRYRRWGPIWELPSHEQPWMQCLPCALW
jgi:hypothetical protein